MRTFWGIAGVCFQHATENGALFISGGGETISLPPFDLVAWHWNDSGLVGQRGEEGAGVGGRTYKLARSSNFKGDVFGLINLLWILAIFCITVNPLCYVSIQVDQVLFLPFLCQLPSIRLNFSGKNFHVRICIKLLSVILCLVKRDRNKIVTIIWCWYFTYVNYLHFFENTNIKFPIWRYTQLLVILFHESSWTWDTRFAFASSAVWSESETRVPSSRGLVKQYNQELCISSNSRCFTKRLQ